MWRLSVRSLIFKAKVSSVKFRWNGSCCNIQGKTWRTPSGFDTGLKTFNSLTKQKEPLILPREGVATWYVILLSAILLLLLLCTALHNKEEYAIFQVQLRTHCVRPRTPGTCMVTMQTLNTRDVRLGSV